jgi:hypothetical protein
MKDQSIEAASASNCPKLVPLMLRYETAITSDRGPQIDRAINHIMFAEPRHSTLSMTCDVVLHICNYEVEGRMKVIRMMSWK